MSAELDKPAASPASTQSTPQTAELIGPPGEAPLGVLTPSIAALLANPDTHGRGNGPVQQAAILQLQRTLGNRPTRHLLQRQPLTAVQRDGPAPAPAAGTTPASPPPPGAIPEELKKFREHGPYPGGVGALLQPKTGLGGFNANYDPVGMTLTITVNVVMQFLNGINIAGSGFAAGSPDLQVLVDALNKTRGAKRAKAVEAVKDNWQWHGQEAAFMTDYAAKVASAWKKKYTFQSTEKDWDSQLANVDVQIHTAKMVDSATGGPPGDPPSPGPGPIHTRGKIFRTAPITTLSSVINAKTALGGQNPQDTVVGGNTVDIGAAVGAGSKTSPTDQTLTLGSNQLYNDVQKLTHSVTFANNSTTLSAAAKASLTAFANTFRAPAGSTGTTIDITGHASTRGGTAAHNQKVSLDRANAVDTFLRGPAGTGTLLANAATRIKSTIGAGTAGADADARWRRVDVVVGGGQAQNVASHEFGHMIGLGDVYAIDRDAAGNPTGLLQGTGPATGGATAHDKLSRDEGLGPAVAENNADMMSGGSTVSQQDYSTFMQALRDVTHRDTWNLKH
ncbi:MAG TPA: OmpA family protein [Chloroflexia bacterium]|nr:OmpA family protein [Chloroflexia bacterium]